jgi:hypothetical protein
MMELTKDISSVAGGQESDPESLSERHKDAPGSFLDVYRSLDIGRTQEDEQLVTLSVEQGVIPSTIRYGLFKGVYRGAVTDTNGENYYFHFSKGHPFKLVLATTDEKQFEINRLLKTRKKLFLVLLNLLFPKNSTLNPNLV